MSEPTNPTAGKAYTVNLPKISKDNKLFHLFNFIHRHYEGNPKNLLEAIGGISPLLLNIGNKKKSKLHRAIQFVTLTIPATIRSAELINNLRSYIKYMKEGEASAHSRYEKFYKEVVDIDPTFVVEHNSKMLGNADIATFLLSCPKTDTVKFIKVYDRNKLEPINSITEMKGEFIILIEYNSIKYAIGYRIEDIDSNIYIKSSGIIYDMSKTAPEKISDIECVLFKEFLKTFDIKNNVLELGVTLTTRPRKKILEPILQYNVNKLSKEIKHTLICNLRRGYAILGKQGVGKTLILHKLESLLEDIIIIYIKPSEFNSALSISYAFRVLKMLQPAVGIVEDLDGMGLANKNTKVSTFINEIDDSNEDLNYVLLVSINDSKLVHKTILDRPGRFDEIIEIKSPQSEKEIKTILDFRFKKVLSRVRKNTNIKFKIPRIKKELIELCLKHKFSQAELTCGIADKTILNANLNSNITNEKFNELLKASIKNMINSKNTLKSYSFSDKNEDYEIPNITSNTPVHFH